MKVMRAGATDEELARFFLDVVERSRSNTTSATAISRDGRWWRSAADA
jgi:hypothetical protein